MRFFFFLAVAADRPGTQWRARVDIRACLYKTRRVVVINSYEKSFARENSYVGMEISRRSEECYITKQKQKNKKQKMTIIKDLQNIYTYIRV